MPTKRKKNLRSQQWFNNPKDPEMTALYLERYLKLWFDSKRITIRKSYYWYCSIWK